MCDKCRQAKQLLEGSFESLPSELRALIHRGPRLPAPDTGVLRSILEAGPGEHQNRLWQLSVNRSNEAAMAELEFMMEKYRPELDAVGQDFARSMKTLMGEHLHSSSPDKEMVN